MNIPSPEAENNSLGKVLNQNKKKILKNWESIVRHEVPAAKIQPIPALIDSLPQIIDTMVAKLCEHASPEEIQGEQEDLAVAHAQERARMANYSIDQVISEFNILREVIFDVIDPKGYMPLKQAKLLWDSISLAINNAATEFAEIRDEEKKQLHEFLSEKNEDLAEKLQITELNYKKIINALEDYAVITLDHNGIITSWNTGAIKMNAYSPGEAIGKHFEMLYPEEAKTRKEPKDNLLIARNEGRYRGEGVRRRKNGEKFIADVYIIPLIENNIIIGFAKVIQDLSERYKLIQDRDLSRSEAIDLRMERQERENFVSTLTHDLRSPLSTALMSAELIVKYSESNSKRAGWGKKIVENIKRTDSMITNLLDANRIKAGEVIPLKLEECNLYEIAKTIADDLAPVHGNRIKIKSESKIIGVWDKLNLIRIIENLTTNALKYGDPLTDVTITLEKISKRVLIKVHNQGNVIKESELSLLFEPYQRTDSALSSSTKGWGLGLTLVKGLTEAHHGIVKVESYPHTGTTFTVDLPLDSNIAPSTEPLKF